MAARGGVGRSIRLLLVVMLVNSCALTDTLTQRLTGNKQGPEVYYTKPAVTYIREWPGYASQHVATVYHGDQVTILSRVENDDWCRVQTPGGQSGWMQRALLSPVPIRVETYYVQAEAVSLRQEPQEEVISRQVLRRGAEVRKLAENEEGWWRVLVDKDKTLGWLPAATLAAEPPKEPLVGVAGRPADQEAAERASSLQPAAKQFFVATKNLELHLLPLVSSEVVKVLQFNNKVEEVYRSGSKWLKVRYPETGVQGWTLASYLSETAAKAPRPVAGKRRKAGEKFRRPDPKKKKLLQPEDLEPEVM